MDRPLSQAKTPALSPDAEDLWKQSHGRFDQVERSDFLDPEGNLIIVSTVKIGVGRSERSGSFVVAESQVFGGPKSTFKKSASYTGPFRQFREFCAAEHAAFLKECNLG